jgi:hypothetical protein
MLNERFDILGSFLRLIKESQLIKDSNKCSKLYLLKFYDKKEKNIKSMTMTMAMATATATADGMPLTMETVKKLAYTNNSRVLCPRIRPIICIMGLQRM